MIDLLDVATTTMAAGTPYCLPDQAENALATAKFWTQLVAIALAVVAVVLIGIGMFFSGRRGDGGEMLKSLGWWIGGIVLIAGASQMVSVFITPPTNCI